MSKKNNNVYILQGTYKECDPETLGVYKSMRGLCRGFADVIAQDCLVDYRLLNSGDRNFNSDLEVMMKKVARKVARLLPDLLQVDFCEDECRDGKTVYGYEAMPVESDEGDEDGEEDEEEDNEDNEEQED